MCCCVELAWAAGCCRKVICYSSVVLVCNTAIRAQMADLIGEDSTRTFYNAWLANHTRRVDIDSMKAWGFNSVRLPMHYNLYTLPADKETEPGKQTWLEKGFQMTDSSAGLV